MNDKDRRSNRALCRALYDVVRETQDADLAVIAPMVRGVLCGTTAEMPITDTRFAYDEPGLVMMLGMSQSHLKNEALDALIGPLRDRLMAAKRYRELRILRAYTAQETQYRNDRRRAIERRKG